MSMASKSKKGEQELQQLHPIPPAAEEIINFLE